MMSLRPTVDEVEIGGTSENEQEHPLACLMREQERKEMEDAMDENERKEREQSASKIQALHRGRKARGNTLVEHKERTLAATKIQAIHRGRQQRREKPRLILGDELTPAKVDASMAYDEIAATRVGITNVLRSIADVGTLESKLDDLKAWSMKITNSRLAKLSDVVLDKWSATEESFLSWRETMDAGQKLVWRSVCQLTMAQRSATEERCVLCGFLHLFFGEILVTILQRIYIISDWVLFFFFFFFVLCFLSLFFL